MHGFTDYFTATSVFAAHQANVTAVVPWVEAQNADGTWTRISDDIGFPAGLLRTMTADLTGKLPAGARRIRIWTNLKIYWDQVLVDTTPEGAVPVRRTEIPLAEASLAFRGFPRELTGHAGDRPAIRARRGEQVRAVRAPSRLLHEVRRGDPAPAKRGGPVRRLRRRRRGRARVRRRRAAAAPAGMDPRLLRLLQRVREGHGLLRGPRADGRPAALQGHARLPVSGRHFLPGPQPRVPARVEYEGGRGRELAELPILLQHNREPRSEGTKADEDAAPGREED